MSNHPEGLYPIRTVAALTGVNPVTLRAWERRYGMIKPQRTPKGHRLYTDADIVLIRRILELMEQGIPISQVRHSLFRPPEEEQAGLQLAATTAPEEPWEEYAGRMDKALARYDLDALDAAYNDALSLYPVELVARDLIQPLLARLARERFREPERETRERLLRSYLRNKLGARYHHQLSQTRGPVVWVACLPGEQSELELLLFALGGLSRGYRVLSLGTDVPPEALAAVCRATDCRALVLFGTGEPDASLIHSRLGHLAADCPAPVFLRGPEAEELTEPLARAGITRLPADPGQALTAIDTRRGRDRHPAPDQI